MSYFCSWSGGKDCCLSLFRCLQTGHSVDLLLTMMCEDGERSRSHGLSKEMLKYQAEALGISWIGVPTSWANYENVFVSTLNDLHSKGYRYGIFGDIDLEEHLAWVKNVCLKAAIIPLHPLWKASRKELIQELLSHDFQARIIAVQDNVLDPNFLGQAITNDVIEKFEKIGIDLCGEKGEYHTWVVDGPCFDFPLQFQEGEKSLRDGVWFIDYTH